MNLEAALFVSKRLQRPVAALIVVAAVQLLAASCTPEMTPMGAFRVAVVRVPIQR